MADRMYDDVVRLAEQLSEDEQNRLMMHLRAQQAAARAQRQSESAPSIAEERESINDTWVPRREVLLHELAERKKQGTKPLADSPYGKFANRPNRT